MKRACEIAIIFLVLIANSSLANEVYPERPVRLIVPFPPGGGVDIFSRILAEKLSESWGKQIVVDNRSGAQGSVGTALGAKATPGGYTLLLAHQGALTINPHLYAQLGYDTLRDFVAVAKGATATPMIVVNPSVQARTISELVKLAKQNPGKLSFASTASGQQVVGELFKITTGTDILHVPYKGGPPAILDLISGNVTMMFASVATTLAQVNAGRLRPLAVLSTKRNEAMPDVPTAVEAGYPELSAALVWYGVVVPTGTPQSIVSKLNTDIVRVINSPEIAKRLSIIGLSPSPSTAKEFSNQIREDFVRWGKVVKAAGIRAE
ncbi:MAG: hypothetical protein A3F74_02040 [Betaproteobacteria bacterium RIFCSPLOWO2_12_FULL_62_58]|nr:MAG: hypothetical protein A3F74_02040 [Betaproteobacteria bacterium RIFCSPLOWO2_12_FULL_62_58]